MTGQARLRPAYRTGLQTAQAPSGSEAEADIRGCRADALALDIFGDVNGGHPRLRADLQFDGNAGIEVDAVENFLDRFR